MCMKYYIIGDFAKRIAISSQTLRNWHKQGRLVPALVTPGGTRYYSQKQLNYYLKGYCYNDNDEDKNRVIVGYCNSHSSTSVEQQMLKIKEYLSDESQNIIIRLVGCDDESESNQQALSSLLRSYEPSEIIFCNDKPPEMVEQSNDIMEEDFKTKVTILN